jgi:transcriptional regulator GlxA family with amidase domain
MIEARGLLTSTFSSVKEVMSQVGVYSDSHFAHDFKTAFGLTPSEYRMKWKPFGRFGQDLANLD